MYPTQIVDIQREIHKDENKSLYIQTFIFVLMNFYVCPYHFLRTQARLSESRSTTSVWLK
jgi:hypothetical protein